MNTKNTPQDRARKRYNDKVKSRHHIHNSKNGHEPRRRIGALGEPGRFSFGFIKRVGVVHYWP